MVRAERAMAIATKRAIASDDNDVDNHDQDKDNND